MSGNAQRLAEAANQITNSQSVTEAYKAGDTVKVPHKGKLDVKQETAEVEEANEPIGETWKSLKKTKANLAAIRASGKRVITQHGEGDTLYKVLPAVRGPARHKGLSAKHRVKPVKEETAGDKESAEIIEESRRDLPRGVLPGYGKWTRDKTGWQWKDNPDDYGDPKDYEAVIKICKALQSKGVRSRTAVKNLAHFKLLWQAWYELRKTKSANKSYKNALLDLVELDGFQNFGGKQAKRAGCLEAWNALVGSSQQWAGLPFVDWANSEVDLRYMKPVNTIAKSVLDQYWARYKYDTTY